jgi:hypothetical protein
MFNEKWIMKDVQKWHKKSSILALAWDSTVDFEESLTFAISHFTRHRENLYGDSIAEIRGCKKPIFFLLSIC